MRFSLKQLNEKIIGFLENSAKIKNTKLRKAILWALYLAFFIFAFGLLPFIFGFYLVIVIWEKVQSPKLKYALSAVVLLFTISIGTAWARTTYDDQYRNSMSDQQTTTKVEEPKAVGGVETKVETKEETKTEPNTPETQNQAETKTEVAPTPTPTPAPAQTLAPTLVPTPAAQPQSNCDPNYSGACVPIASDVDCAGGSGNGPAYVQGPVKVIGSDIYDLDRDSDGWGCE